MADPRHGGGARKDFITLARKAVEAYREGWPGGDCMHQIESALRTLDKRLEKPGKGE